MGFVADAVGSVVDTVAGVANTALSVAGAFGVPGAAQAQAILGKAVDLFKPDSDAYQESGDSREERRKKLIDNVSEKIPGFIDDLRAQGVNVQGYERSSDYDSEQELKELRDVFESISEEESVSDDVREEAGKIVDSFNDALFGSTLQESEDTA